MAPERTLRLGIFRPPARAEDERGVCPRLRQVEIGDLVTYQNRAYVLRGLEPMSVPDRRAELEDPETGEIVMAPLADVSPQDR